MARINSIRLTDWTSTLGVLTSDEGVYSLTSSSYRGSASMDTDDSFKAVDCEIRLEWEAFNTNYATHYLRLIDDEGNIFSLNKTAYTTSHSYGGSLYIQSDTRFFTRVDILDGVATTVTSTGTYDDLGGSVLYTESEAAPTTGTPVHFTINIGDNYQSTKGGVHVYSLFVFGNFFDGNFLPLETGDDVIEEIAIPSDLGLSTSVGSGLLNNQGSTVYLRVSESINQGEGRSIVTVDGTLLATITYGLDGVLTIHNELSSTTAVGYSEELLVVTTLNGQLLVSDIYGDVVLSGDSFDMVEGVITVALVDGATINSIPWDDVDYENPIYAYVKNPNPPKPTWGNKETREQANPQQVDIFYEVLKTPNETLIAKSGNYLNSVDNDGNWRAMGYYESVTTLSNNPIGGRRVLCFTNAGELRDQTISGIDGSYRFDHLLMSEKYMFVAQYNTVTRDKPDYLAAASDWQTPTPY